MNSASTRLITHSVVAALALICIHANAMISVADDLLHGTQGSGFVGISSSGESLGDHRRLFPLLRQADITMVRSFPEWGAIQPRRGEWDWLQADALIESARTDGIQISGVLCYLAPWTSSAAPGDADYSNRSRTFPIRDLQDWRSYVTEVVTRYHKDVHCWEIYNEFNSQTFARNAVVKDYADMVRIAHDVARQIDPMCRIGIGCAEADFSFLEQVICQGASDRFDFVSVHPYCLLDAAMEGRESVFLQIQPNFRRMLLRTRQRQEIALWVGEIGLATTDAPELETRQAEAVAKALILSAVQGVDRVLWFEGRGPIHGPDGEFGIVRQNWTKRPSFEMLRFLTRHLGTCPEYLGWHNCGPGIYGFVFRGIDGPVLVAWAASRDGGKLRFQSAVTITNSAGDSDRIDVGQEIVLNTLPVFISDVPAEVADDARGNRIRPFPWLKDFSQVNVVSCRMAAADTAGGVTLLDCKGGKTQLGLIDGHAVRRTDKAMDSPYMYFDVDDSFASIGDSELEITITAMRVNAASPAGCNLFCETATGYRHIDKWWSVPAEPGWHSHTFEIKDAYFANNWGWNFRIQTLDSPDDLWVKEVAVKRLKERK